MKVRNNRAIRSAHRYYNRMLKEDTILVYCGAISSDLISSILQMAETKMEAEDESRKVKKKVFNVLVECLQNVYHHMEDSSQTDHEVPAHIDTGLVMIGKSDNDYYVVTGNLIKVENIPMLRKKLKQVNQLDSNGLKQLYRMVLNDPTFSTKGTAGLGILDIARKSGNRIGYRFEQVNENYSFFTLESRVPRQIEARTPQVPVA